jgi:hypothetical protein
MHDTFNIPNFPDPTTFDPLETKTLSVSHVSPLGSQTSFGTLNQTRIENVADWDAISKKYRALVGLDGDESGSMKDASDDDKSRHDDAGATAAQPTVQGNSAAANLV